MFCAKMDEEEKRYRDDHEAKYGARECVWVDDELNDPIKFEEWCNSEGQKLTKCALCGALCYSCFD